MIDDCCLNIKKKYYINCYYHCTTLTGNIKKTCGCFGGYINGDGNCVLDVV